MNRTERRILAKSSANGRDITLGDHTRDVLGAISALFGRPNDPTHLARSWLRLFRLPLDAFDAFLCNLWVAGAFHDSGKANAGFQAAILRRGQQLIRHEHLSALLLWQEPLYSWLQGQAHRGLDAEVVASAVASHHLKTNPEEFARWLTESEHPAVHLCLDSADIGTIGALAAQGLGVAPVGLGTTAVTWDRATVAELRDYFCTSMHRFDRLVRRDEARNRLLLAVKAALIAADSAGSATPRLGQSLEDWLDAAFTGELLTGADVERAIIAPRVEELRRRGRWQGFKDFQLAAGQLGPRALLLSGCGTGKTLAAWKWIGAQLDRYELSRVIFLYPTRGTATEGFRDYASWAGPEVAALVHGTSQYDLQGMFDNPADPRTGQDYTTQERLFALAYWHRRIFSATVDSFLAFMSHRYASLCLLPLVADSVIVVDEVHSFDNHMFRALERFLNFFDVPVLCMTASLPPDRLRVLRDACRLETFPRSPDQFADLNHQAGLPRYNVRWISQGETLDVARLAFQAQHKVLWVVNTVARCQAIVRDLEHQLGAEGMRLGNELRCYHSRYRLKDRRQRHREAVDAFRSDQPRPIILVSTQVCEMSLDLDADVLITEVADVSALIQRMGRCCREGVPAEGRIGEVFIYPPSSPLPYSGDDVLDGEAFARAFAAHDLVSQADLTDYLAEVPTRERFATGGFTGFLDSGWYAMGRDDTFRETDDYAVDAILDADLTAYLRARRSANGQADAFIVPVPRRYASPNPRLGPFLREAPTAQYDPYLGFVALEGQGAD